MAEHAKHLYAFGPFRLDDRERLLACDGKPVPLQPKVFDLLLLLVRNAGSLTEKEVLLQNLWTDSFVEEGNLSKHISILRKALGGGANGTVYIETAPKRGYRFVAEVIVLENGAAPKPSLLPDPPPRENTPPARPRSHARALLIAAAVAAGAVAIAAGILLPPDAGPKVLRTVQLTHSGRVEWIGGIFTDGARVYFEERNGGRYTLAWVSSAGGEVSPIPTPFPNVHLLGISPDHSELLVGTFTGNDDDPHPLWALATSGGSPRRLGNITAHDAAWTPDGEGIVFSAGDGIYRARKDGSGARKISAADGNAHFFRWSPGGGLLRFTSIDAITESLALREAQPDGSRAHDWLPEWRQRPRAWNTGECCGIWTPDGRYFILRSLRDGAEGFWALRENARLFHQPDHRPAMLYTTQLRVRQAAFSPDGSRLFFPGGIESRELQRYDARSKHFVPHFAGPPARWVSFSKDGSRAAYSIDLNLWQSRADGSERRKLTFPPLAAAAAEWSPDEESIAFRGTLPGDGGRVYTMPSGGGTPEALTAQQYAAGRPYWSPDGNSLVFAQADGPVLAGPDCAIRTLNLKSRRVAEVPGSRGMAAEGFSPDGRYLAAMTMDNTKLMLRDLRAGRWMELARGNSLFGVYWSRDSNWIYFQDLKDGVDQPISRIHLASRRLERVAGLSQFERADALAYSLAGITPDGSPLVSLILGRGEVYALDLAFR
jgi:DNA-binding winged helix-turn-helix (wHTH) protein/Tol biopolymer transport system component